MTRAFSKIFASLTFALASAAAAQAFGGEPGGPGGSPPPTPPSQLLVEWDKRQNIEDRLQPLGNDILGDQIDPHQGGISFTQTDISLPGNFALPVALTRKISQGMRYADHANVEFGDWTYDVPRIVVNSVTNRPFTGNRCSQSFNSRFTWIQYGGSVGNVQFMQGHEYTDGVSLEVPGYGSQQVLQGGGGHPMWPANATHTTTGNWYLYCGSASDGGQGFIAKAPNGDTYTFDRVITKPARPLGVVGSPTLARNAYILAATKVEDIHGNRVNYIYDSAGRLDKIQATDGRLIDLSYSGSSKLVSSVTAHGRTWTYGYRTNTYQFPDWEPAGYSYNSNIVGKTLSGVTLPDGRSWSFTLDNMRAQPRPGKRCVRMTHNISLTHPNGVTGEFRLRDTYHRAYTLPLAQQGDRCPSREPLGNITNPFSIPHFIDVTATPTMSVIEKKLTAAGAPTATWSYEYESDEGTNTGGERTNWTKIQGPTNHITVYHYWNSEPDAGRMKREETRASASGPLLEKREFQYLYETSVGSSYYTTGAHPKDINTPVRTTETKTTRGSDVFTTVNTYNTNQSSANYSYGAPINVALSSSVQTETRQIATTYEYKKSDWILSLPKTITRNGKQIEAFTYDAFGNPTNYKQYGYTVFNYAYNGDGNLTSATDALGRTTTVSNYKRGVPQSMTRPDGTTVSAVVDNFGQITSSTDARNTTTGYTYNSMGWLTKVDRPGSWADTNISYSTPNTGIIQNITRGNGRTIVTYDPYQRTKLVQSIDLTGGAQANYVKTNYDAGGRTIFTSLPSHSANPTVGMETTYDALDRVTRTRENVSPFATTNTAYLSGNRVRVTDPEGGITTTTYRAFGAPATDEAILISDPTGTTTTLTRNIHGNVTALNQASGLNGYNVNVTRNFWYDSRLRLCRHYAPEFGHELFAYNNANELISQSRDDTAGSSCGTPAANIATRYQYDAMGRQKKIDFPSGTPDIFKGYDANGNLLTVNRVGRNWTYIYDDLNQLTRETLSIDGLTFDVQHAYNSSGHNWQRRLPDGKFMRFDPNGFGQPRYVRQDFDMRINNITYHPNGQVASANYLNGTSYSQSLNARQLVSSMSVSKSGQTITNASYGHNKRGQITSLNGLAAGGNISYDYDAKGRLIEANGPFGLAEYTYDGLDNLRLKEFPNRTVTLNYDNTKNRLTSAFDTREGVNRPVFTDRFGNVYRNGNVRFWHDKANQPTSIWSLASSDNMQNAYDGNLKRVKSTTNGETTYWVYSALTGTPIYSRNTTTNEVSHYIDGGGARLKIVDNVVTWTHLDHQGSAVAATDASGATLWTERYLPFGEKLIDPSANQDRPGYTGHVQDSWSGLTYMQARYYDPVLGRFMQTDPIGYQDQLNLYAYVHNDPMNNIDPTGMWALGLAKKVGKLITKGGDVGATFAGAISDAKAVFARPGSTTLGARGAALVSLGTEIFSPVSAREAKAGVDAAGNAIQARRGAQVGEIIDPNGTTTATDIIKKSEDVGFTRTQSPNGPLKMVDENGTARVTVKSGSARAPGSQGPHVELKDSSGQRVNPAGESVTRKSIENHTPIIDDRE